MKIVRTIVSGESYITLEGVVDCYACELTWLRTVYQFGLLGHGVELEGATLIRSAMLDRVAEILRLSVYQGVDLPAIAVLIGKLDD